MSLSVSPGLTVDVPMSSLWYLCNPVEHLFGMSRSPHPDWLILRHTIRCSGPCSRTRTYQKRWQICNIHWHLTVRSASCFWNSGTNQNIWSSIPHRTWPPHFFLFQVIHVKRLFYLFQRLSICIQRFNSKVLSWSFEPPAVGLKEPSIWQTGSG